MTQVTARFYVDSITLNNTPYARVELKPVLRSGDEGNKSWSQYTPSGGIWLNVTTDPELSGAYAEFEAARAAHQDVAITFERIIPGEG